MLKHPKRLITLAIVLGSVPVVLAAFLYRFGSDASSRLLTILALYPGILLNGLFTGNPDSAFDTVLQTTVTFAASWLFWFVVTYLVLRLIRALNSP